MRWQLFSGNGLKFLLIEPPKGSGVDVLLNWNPSNADAFCKLMDKHH